MKKLFTSLFISISFLSVAQNSSVKETKNLQELYQEFRLQETQDSIQTAVKSKRFGVSILEKTPNGAFIGLMGFEKNGFPIFYATDNRNASKTVGTNLVVAGAANGYGLTGGGIIIGEWDGARVLSTHQEFAGRVTQIDNPTDTSDHSTHVCGTMIASGMVASAKGMAPAATVKAYDFYNTNTEMTTFGATGIISNHSYGTITGWRYMTSTSSWRWYGDTTLSSSEDYRFGFYTSSARSWDLIANAAPKYLIVKSAGNDRGSAPGSGVTSHEIWDPNSGWVTSTVSRPADGGTDGYDCISTYGNSKNILTVGAVNDITAGYTQPSDVVMSSFSGWGPTDDGRIKPDIVANGVSLYSTGKASNTDYYSSSGTSMAAPNATGSMALLQEMYNDSNGVFMNSATLKALVIHTANEAGTNPGPDFSFGWGLLNIKGAADLIADTITNKIIESSLINLATDTFTFYSDGSQNIEATLAWNDPAGNPVANAIDPTTSMLINDLDLRISNATGTIKMPWTLNSAIPSSAAVRGDNVKDNVENASFDSPTAGYYTFTITHKGNLAANQDFSLIISGVSAPPAGPAPTPSFTGTPTTICSGDSIQFTDTSTGSPTSLEWTFTGGTPATSTSPNPVVQYNTAGTYSVKLKATNANGSDSVTIAGYITVNASPNVTTSPFPTGCMNGGTIPLNTGGPLGGTWSGTGVSGFVFDPLVAGLGQHTVTYSFTLGSCTATSSEVISVTAPPTVNLPSYTASICSASTAFNLTGGTPIGGTYTGTGVTNNSFDPAVAGLGSHLMTYTYTDSNGCSGTDTASIIVVTGLPTSLGTFTGVCANSPIVTLTGGTPAGGRYTGLGVDTTAGTFDPSIAGAGTHTITYFGLGGACVSAATSTITVNALPNVSLAAFSDQCMSSTAVVLTGGIPAGGTYSGTNVTAGNFDASAAGLGSHTIYYSVTDTNACTNMDSNQISVVSSIQYYLGSSAVCEGTAPFVITSGTPAGGTYSGPGIVNGNTFDPALAGVGTQVISYTDTSSSCALPGYSSFNVYAYPNASLNPFSTLCLNGGPIGLYGGSPAGGHYYGTGIVNDTLDPTVNGAGTMQISYVLTVNGCSDTATQTVTIGMSVPVITNISASYCINEQSVVLQGNPTGGIFSGSGITGASFNPNDAGIGTHQISYTVSGGCAGSASYAVTVHPKPTISTITGPIISSQHTPVPYSVVAQNGAYYNWIPTNGNVVSNANNQVIVNWDSAATGTLMAIMHDQNGCMDTTKITVELWPLGIDENTAISNLEFFPNPATKIISFQGDGSGDLALAIYNLAGQRVHYTATNFSGKTFKWEVDISHFSASTYIFQISRKDKIIGAGQFIKQ
tara:strand:- start:130787 stop:134845 length:4059 start_codon:yes stop_codon:yes gene_type:complete